MSAAQLDLSPENGREGINTFKATRKILTIDQLRYRPGRINNRYLVEFDEDSELKLKSGLVENQDYTLVDAKTWKYLKKWYG